MRFQNDLFVNISQAELRIAERIGSEFHLPSTAVPKFRTISNPKKQLPDLDQIDAEPRCSTTKIPSPKPSIFPAPRFSKEVRVRRLIFTLFFEIPHSPLISAP